MLYFPEVKTKNALVENCVILGQGKRFFFFRLVRKVWPVLQVQMAIIASRAGVGRWGAGTKVVPPGWAS